MTQGQYQPIGIVGRVLANDPGDQGSVSGQVIPKTQKMVLDAARHNTQHYKVRIKSKVDQSRERKCSPQHLGLVATEKEAFESPSITVTSLLTAGLNSEFSFSLIGCLTMDEKPSLPHTLLEEKQMDSCCYCWNLKVIMENLWSKIDWEIESNGMWTRLELFYAMKLLNCRFIFTCNHIYQPLRSGRIWLKVNF